MFSRLLKSFNNEINPTVEAEAVRQQFQSIFFKIRTYQKYLLKDEKVAFKVTDDTHANKDLTTSGHVTYYLGAYVIRYDLDDLKSIQLFRRGKVDNLQFAELLAISFYSDIEYIADQQFVKADIYQIEILINRVIKNRNRK